MYLAHNAIQARFSRCPHLPQGKGAAAGLATINMVGILGGVIYPPLMGLIRDRTGDYQSGLGVLSLTMLAPLPLFSFYAQWLAEKCRKPSPMYISEDQIRRV